MSKGSRFHCASLWTPFMFLACVVGAGADSGGSA